MALGLGLGVVGCGGSDESVGPSEANPLDAEESRLVYDLNRAREDAGIAQIAIVCSVLNTTASAHSDEMRDTGVLSDKGADGSTPRSRACDAGYASACDGSATIAEVIGSGYEDGKASFANWLNDEPTKAVLLDPQYVTLGIGRSLGGTKPIWTLDLASIDDPSCH